ncbi:MAG: hypothetical protein COX29_03410 [Candidatus Moranbacteria bacterium CG23_combo_of_CG06-09_8_20_14_all_35_22]|nr:MAG: hypothetical protein COX29_03410 [Candidatus Moranbacteria bacterium CG23_combo_of_CG06-09_8_20_14_all_35_22]
MIYKNYAIFILYSEKDLCDLNKFEVIKKLTPLKKHQNHMNNKNLIISIFIAVIVTVIIFLSPISLSNMVHCQCGGCCVGCPGDCNTKGAPFAYYYWGVNGMDGEVVNQISTFGIIADTIIWGIFMFFIYKFIYKK